MKLHRLVLAGALLASIWPAHAATLVVNDLGDAGPGNCATTCTLRDAIANAAPDDVVTFASTLNYPATITLAGHELLVYKNLTILGPGASLLRVSGNSASRLFEIAANASVSISGLTLTSGVVSGVAGGTDAQGNGLPGGPGVGGAVLVNAGSTLQIVACVLRDNTARGGMGGWSFTGIAGSGGSARGGAIASAGTLQIADTTLVGNRAEGGWPPPPVPPVLGGAGGDAQGGAIHATGLTEVSNSQFLNNQALGGRGGDGFGAASGDGGFARGGAVATSGFAVLAFVSAVGNSAVPGYAGVGQPSGDNGSAAGSDLYSTATVLSRYSALTSTTAGTVDGTIAACSMTASVTQGANLDADGSCPNFSLHGNDKLQIITNGGATFAYPRWGSPLIDAAADCKDAFGTTVLADVRGGMRPLDANADGIASCDIGAVESDELFANDFE